MKTRSQIASFLIACVLTATARGEDWPGWRGPRGDGQSREAAAPLHWSPTENVVWKTPVPGQGRSSPIVIGNRIFLTTGEDDGSRRVLCFDRANGAVLWNVAVHRGPGGKMHRMNTTASSTPVTDGERVYAAFCDDQALRVVAVDITGHVIWSTTPGTFYSHHGFAASPVLYGETVIVNGHQDGEAFVVALKRDTGSELWRYQPPVKLRSFSTPVLIEYEAAPQLILTGSSQTVGLDPASGKVIWFAAGPSDKFVSTPSVGHGMVFSFGGSDEKKAMAVRLGGAGDVVGTHVVWRRDKSMPYVPSPLLVGDFLHVVNDEGVYTCIEPKSGETHLMGRKLGPVNSSPVAVAGRIYFFEISGRCTVIENGPAFKVLATNELEDEVYATPAISNGNLFVRTETQLFCIGSESGAR